MGAHPDRNAQFENIGQIKAAYLARGEPVLSIDTNKKELIGNFAREGQTHTQAQVQTLDHDFPSAGQGKLIPHGLYDVARNEGYLHLNTSTETSEFCCDSIAHWWTQHGSKHYPDAKRVLVLCDGGGSNASNRHVFKEALQRLPDRLGLEVRIAHYPPYCSKHNPIEHRSVRPCDPRLPGRDVSHGGDRPAVHGKSPHNHWAEGDGRGARRGLRQRQKGGGGLLGKHAYRLRCASAALELSGRPGQWLSSGSYF